MTLIQSAKLNGHDPYAYLKDVLTRLPTQKNNAIDELLPHNWTPAIPDKVGLPDASQRITSANEKEFKGLTIMNG
jgi:hypothetical protein